MNYAHGSMPLPVWDFRGESLVVSGGARGIGGGIVRHFARCGARVLFGDIDTVGGMQLCEELTAEGHAVYFCEIDFTASDAWLRLREAAECLDLAPSLVVSNVGIGLRRQIEETSVDEFDRILNVNLRSAWLAARDFGPVLEQRPGASLLLVGSVMASFGSRAYSPYTISKAALSGLLRALCVEFGPKGVRVNMLVPGYIMTDPPSFYRSAMPPVLWREFYERFCRDALDVNPPEQPLASWGTVEDIAQAAAFLHSPAARYITGIELRVDGGLLCQSPIRGDSGNEAWRWTPEMKEWLHDRGVGQAD